MTNREGARRTGDISDLLLSWRAAADDAARTVVGDELARQYEGIDRARSRGERRLLTSTFFPARAR